MTSRHAGSESRHIARRIVIEGDLVLQTPAHFGGGESDGTTVLLLEDPLSGSPLLPGASLAGALRHYLVQREFGFRAAEESGSLAAQLFGTAYDRNRGAQSRVIVDDALGSGEGHLLEGRDGVKINEKYRTAEEGGLYSFNVWTVGTCFSLRLELCLYQHDPNDVATADDADRLVGALATALTAVGEGQIPLGGRKHRGYGRAKVTGWRVRDYRFETSEGLVDWLQHGGLALNEPTHASLYQALGVIEMPEDARSFVRIDAEFSLEDSLLIRAGADIVDMAHLMSRNADGELQAVLSGTSIAGALRARTQKIAATLNVRHAKKLIDDMFGKYGGDREISEESEPSASRVIVEEHLIEGGLFDPVQNRVRIDRFTGGAFDTGLFGQQPVFANEDTMVPIKLELRYPANASEEELLRVDAEAGLLLLTLKDLWTRDLPLGGESSIGRGRLSGRKATITLHTPEFQNEISLRDSPHALSPEERDQLERFVTALQGLRRG
ncbi:MAG: RAMP superfamily CRISPR-associated protein [Anaerolineae bacterium]|nr:RAMP superfamily CRISPR-associated protein [Anaerolineae bacterium]NUQ06856.1 hypothetical protein [Anaerolineae bacterium]